MKNKIVKISTKRMRITVSFLLMTIVTVTLFSFTTQKLYDDLWEELGLKKGDAEYSIGNSLLYGYLQHYSARNAKNIVIGDRAAVVKELGAFSKEYVNSDDFRKQYEAMREQQKPAVPAQPKTAEELRKQYIEDAQKTIEATEEAMSRMQDDLKPAMQASIDVFKQQVKDYEDPENETIKMMADYEKTAYEYNTQDYQKKMEIWEKEWPADQMQLVKKRLQQFLDKTKDVDFTATLKDGYGGKKVFVNPQYESKPADWKKAYRAGKEATSAAREFAEEWLKELN